MSEIFVLMAAQYLNLWNLWLEILTQKVESILRWGARELRYPGYLEVEVSRVEIRGLN